MLKNHPKDGFYPSSNVLSSEYRAADVFSGLKLHEISMEERPREKVLEDPISVKGLTDSELIAILLRTGTKQLNVLDLSKKLLSSYEGNLYRIYKDLLSGRCTEIAGLGAVKKITLLAAMELGIRTASGIELNENIPMKATNPHGIYQQMKPYLFGLTEEQLWLLTVGSGGFITNIQNIARGGIDETVADIRTILRQVLRIGTPAFVLVHNHPGGTTSPSSYDDDFTLKLYEAAKVINLTFLDHLIFSDYGYFSYHENDKIL